MSRRLLTLSAKTALLSLLIVFGLALGAWAAAPKDGNGTVDEAAVRAKIARIQKGGVTQEEREAAAARLRLQQTLSAPSLGPASGLKVSALGVSASAIPAPGPGGVPDVFGSTPNWAYSPLLRKFVDGLPGLGASHANNLGQYIPVAKPDTITYPGSDYYVIELREYEEQMHSDLPATRLRGYVQTNSGTDEHGHNTLSPDPIHYLGPLIVANKDRPVRVKFTNKLATGTAGDLFIPVDPTVMGAGMGPLGDSAPNYTQNRATIHLHGGVTPWISDGTPHQWITPAGEDTPYPKGVSVRNVPDMPDPGDGSQTFFYTNQQSARLMFYHDHSFGITRLNVAVGEAAGYLITDATEQKLIADHVIPEDQIPLIIQDKTYVDAATIGQTDPTWNWGTTAPIPHTGDLWWPHVYVPAQNPADRSGMNATGRWMYGPWFWPPTNNITHPPIPNPYYDPANAPWEPPLMPATPNPSMVMEAFSDTPLVNGTAYPKLEIDPKSYRLRILNAANDRFWNLQMYVADGSVVTSDGRKNTEVKMVPASTTETYFPELWPVDGRDGGVPDPRTAGPVWMQIGTEGGFLPKPVLVPQQPITWNTDPTTFNAGNVQDHSLLLGPAERADVVVDFSKYAGKTIILYNDAPAAFPARDARLDYYTNDPDRTGTGGALPTQPGFGPNTRTIMQIKVKAETPAPAFDLEGLELAFESTQCRPGVFKASQPKIIVPDARYNSAYNATFTADPYVRIYQTEMTFRTLDDTTITIPFNPKAMHDEMGASFDKDYGRMSGNLGVELPGTNAAVQNMVLYSFIDPPTENVTPTLSPLTPVGLDGTQIWKITHNGVDTHPIHFHLMDVQLINRVGWDGALRPPDDNELGWKDTVRISPLEDTIVALRPILPKTPWGSPDSIRPLNPAEPIGSTMGFANLDPKTAQPITPPITNQLYNFGWEYVWHCHILSHEEMDMMRPISMAVARSLTPTPSLAATGLPGAPVNLTWVDGTPLNDPLIWGDPANEIGFRIERATVDAGGVESVYTVLGTALANATSYEDTTTASDTAYRYRIFATNAAGEVESNAVTVSPLGFFSEYTIRPTAFMGGTITPDTTQTVASGADSSTFAIAADANYHIADVLVDGVSVGAVPTYQFANVTGDHTIWAIFAIDTHTITASAGSNGSIVPPGTSLFGHGTDTTFTIIPEIGYHVADVVVDGSSQGPRCTYAFNNITESHTISATFAIDTYTLTPLPSANGTMSPGGVQSVTYKGDGAVFTMVPNVGYHVADVLVDGDVSVGAVSTYQFKNVRRNHTIQAVFEINSYTITPSAGANGSISPGTAQVVTYGSDAATFTMTPSAGYHIADVVIDGSSVGRPTSYAFTNVTANHSITVSFDADSRPVSRISGLSRYDVSKSAAQAAYPGWAGVKHVVLASGEDRAQPDALTAAGLAGVLDAPLLLVPSGSINAQALNALSSMPAGVQVHIVGGTRSVSANVQAQIGVIGTVASVDRIAGSNRFGTAAAVARRMKTELTAQGKSLPPVALITNGNIPTAMFDALTASPISAKMHYPVLLVRNTSIPAETSQALSDLGLSQRYIIGGTSSVAEPVRASLGVAAGNRISGRDRYSTATAAAMRAKSEGWLVNGVIGFSAKIPDAATGGAYMGKRDGAIVYVRATSVPAATSDYLTGNKSSIKEGYVFGGASSVSEAVRTQLQALIK